VNHGNFVGTHFDYLAVQETSTAGDPEPVFGAPVITPGDELVFSPPVFSATAAGAGGFDQTGALLETTIQSAGSRLIDRITIDELGEVDLSGVGTPSTGGLIGMSGSLVVQEDTGGPIAPVVIPFTGTFTPADVYGLPADLGLTPFQGSVSVDVAAVVPNATKVFLSFDNDLVVSSESGTTAIIRKTPTVTISVVSEPCDNDLDDDGDGFVDLQDPGCADATDPSEAHLRPGDIVVAQANGGLALFDPLTTRLEPFAAASEIGSAWDVEVDGYGRVFATDWTGDALVEIDPESGQGSIVSSVGSLFDPTGIALLGPDSILVASPAGSTVDEVQISTGVQTSVSPTPALTDPRDLLLDPSDGSVLVTDANGLYRLTDPLGTAGLTSLPLASLFSAHQMAFDSPTSIILSDIIEDRPYRYDLVGLSDSPLISLLAFFTLPRGTVVEPSGLVLVSDESDGKIARVSETADTATVLDPGSQGPLRYMAPVPDDYDLTLELSETILVDGGTLGVADVGDTLELSAVVTNNGAGSADLLSLESGLDPNLTFVASSLSTTQGSIIEGSLASDPRLEVDLGTLAASASATVTWEVVVSDPAPDRHVSANAWIRREQLILAESDDPSTGPAPDPNVMRIAAHDIEIQAFEKLSDTRGELSGPGNPGAALADGDALTDAESVGDLDGDGIDDLIIATRNGGLNTLHIARIRADGTVKSTTVVATPAGVTSGDSFGRCPSYLGDLDGAGAADFAVAVGAVNDDGSGTDRGAAYVLFLQNDGTLVTSTKIGDGGAGGLPNGSLPSRTTTVAMRPGPSTCSSSTRAARCRAAR
jgi:uncharacterized repeat protein (TIGR01451 family)